MKNSKSKLKFLEGRVKLTTIFQLILIALFVIFSLDLYGVIAYFADTNLIPITKFHLKNIFVAYIIFFIFILTLQRFLPTWLFKTILVLISIPISVGYLFIIGHIIYFGGSLDIQVIETIFDTNIAETKEFIGEMLSYKVILLLLILAIPYLIIFFMKPIKTIKKKVIIPLIVIAIVASVFTLNKKWVHREIPYIYNIKQYFEVKKERLIFAELMQKKLDNPYHFDGIISNLNDNNSQTFIVVFGESNNRLHMSLYGYERKTNPKLEEIKDKLFIFTDVMSPHTFTNSSMHKYLTFNTLEKEEDSGIGDIIDFFKSAGFRTYWLSNQFYIGYMDNLYSMIAFNSDEKYFLNQVTGYDVMTKYYDDKLLEKLSEVIHEPYKKKIIFIHLFGSHNPFIARYPKGFGDFDDESVELEDILGDISKNRYINTYDNSIQFTDYVLSQIIKMSETVKGEKFMLYLPDHGVDVYDSYSDKKHLRSSDATATLPIYQIPLIVYISDEYRKSYPEFTDNLNKYLNRPYQTDKITEAIINLSQLKHKDVDESRSIFSDKFIERKRYINNGLELMEK